MKIVDGASFGYRTIVVEQPLRGRYVLDPARWTALPGDKPFAKLDEDVRGRLARAMAELGDGEFDSEAELRMVLAGKAADADLPKLGAPLLKALVARCLVRDPDAALMTDGHGNQIPDSDRRDTENVPLDEDVEAYPDREVRPHVPGAWCPDHQGEVGYEIPFTRLFYKYTPPRPSAEIRGRAEGTRGRDPSALGRAHRMSYPLVALKRLADRVKPGWSPPSDGLIADERDIGVLSLDAISEAGRPAWPCFEGGRPERRHTSLS